ncbi:TPA: IS4 family transposase [Legionella pneumophila]|uniref:IS4 family transposase n=5 Tax=Legionella pneumophila TaxID=446 RepID=UPI0006796392|nr:IS4 family transposase [Legionella pneumophila]HAT8894320.1 IS4 family transposase [Legionella pneumophila subsp. pneumophila]MCW8402942.1 IS4 family transposase [Legionella pneumophila]MCW8403152.1 IS4 family transposase [Legionella pneumophila]MCW8458265.1 IS4 family transposase [Legionella pneumophila]MCW8476123.1 IS4 family transposase [Legionella pneumophila]
MKDTVFQEIIKPITTDLLKECVTIFKSDYDYEKFKTYEHLQSMLYVHLNQISSLRTLETAINSQDLGLSAKICRSTLSDANRRRKADCFLWILEQLLEMLPKKQKKEFSKIVRVLDSSPIQLKGYGYEWAKHNATRRCEGLKLHVEYDLGLESPTRVALSFPNFNDSSMGKQWPIETDIIYVFDKGYCDYDWWWSIHQKKAFFVSRLKVNAAISIEQKFETNENSPILEDGLFRFSNPKPRGGKKNLYTSLARRISVQREDKDPLILVTNLLDEPAEMIAQLYKSRWEIELFFKWIKQRLKIKKFLGKSENAVKIQLITAIIAYLLVFLFKNSHNQTTPLYLMLVWIKCNLEKPVLFNAFYLDKKPMSPEVKYLLETKT